MKEHRLKTTRTARFFTLGTITERTKNIWFVIHGYGQLAEYFIRNFTPIHDEENVIVAPEALSRFYLSGYTGRVGASWMTKEDRDSEIEDYIQYMNQVYQTLKPHASININILGFSQGVSTAYRWALSSQLFNPNKLILWAGIFPPDIKTDFGSQIDKLKAVDTYVVYGTKDPMLQQEHLEKFEAFKKVKKDLEVITFEGEHEINKAALLKIVERES
ncbi:hypothetical protein RCC89_15435 [Cytophagaceae bacterium ABcell3]|nr:hypothetical protein RCC89_15435 [Cytophagaceae bacterium ABcell3]